jgi:hypothetical protein
MRRAIGGVLLQAMLHACAGAESSTGHPDDSGVVRADASRSGKPDAVATRDASDAMRADGGSSSREASVEPSDASDDYIGRTIDGAACLVSLAPCVYHGALACCPDLWCTFGENDASVCMVGIK